MAKPGPTATGRPTTRIAILTTTAAETTVRPTLSQLRTAATLYVPPADREAARLKIADGLWSLAEAAEPGSLDEAS